MKISVIGGAGRAGLPLSLMLASKGEKVNVIDKDEKKIKSLLDGKMPFIEKGSGPILKKFKKNIFFTNIYTPISKSNIVILTTGTPIDEHLNPQINSVTNLIFEILPYLKNNQLLILRNTLYPGTTSIIANILKSKNLKIDICYCPERIAQGYGVSELKSLPQIISGNNLKAIKKAKRLFSKFNKNVYELSFEEAEIAKLFSNAWRYIKFSIANQFYSICLEKNLNFKKIRKIMMENYERANDFPDSGFSAGPCLLKDTMQLASYSRDNFSLGHESMIINETLPNLLVTKLKLKTKLFGKKIGILGMTFKPNNDDYRDSLAFKLKKILQFEGAKVYCSDVYINKKEFYNISTVLNSCKIIFIGCPHDEYKKIKFSKDKLIINCWGNFEEKYN